jgi:NAD(P)-dependent dehydrogenase (short-subunit alcohol dehydrogenase family)
MVPQLTLGRSARMRRERIVDFRSRDVVITGGTGALGAAVVETLLEAGAICHVPYIVAREAELFPHRGHPNVKLSADIDLTQEDIVGRSMTRSPRSGHRFISPAALRWRRLSIPSAPT